ncbi:MAG TPA: hypothetical protein VGF17_21880 [Phytomonospora sp.]
MSDETTPSPSPSDSPKSRPRLAISRPGFLAPPSPTPSPSESPSERTEGPSPEPLEDVSAPAWSDQLPELEPLEDAPRRRKTGASPASSLASKAAIEDGARRVVLIVTEAAHQTATAGDIVAQELGIWLADDQDVDGIAKPAAAIAARRSPEVGGDLVDGIALAIAVAGYVVKQFSKLRALRTARRAGLDTQTDPEGPTS